MKVWLYYNPTIPEVIIYGTEPPEHFGRRQNDIGPIELDDDLIERYEAAKDAWQAAHSEMVAAVKTAGHLVDIQG